MLLVAQTLWRPTLEFTLSDWIFLVAVVILLPILFMQGKVEVPIPKPVLIGLGLILVGGLLSTPGAPLPLSSLFSLIKMCYLVVIWFSLGIILLRRTEDVQKAMMFWGVSAGITSAAAAAQMIWGDIIPGTSPVWGRMTGFAEHVNDLGGITSIALVPALYVATIDGQRIWVKFCLWLTAWLILSGLVWSGSLSGMLGAAAAVFLWLVLHKRGLRHVLVLIIGGGAIVGSVHIVSTAKMEEPTALVAKVESQTADVVEPERGKSEGPTPPQSVSDKPQLEVANAKKMKGEEPKTESVLTEEERFEKALLEASKNYRVQRDEPPMLLVRLLKLKEQTLYLESLQLRFKHFQKTWESISKNIFVGVGIGPRNGSVEMGQSVHNLLLGSWYEGGLFAFLGIIILLGAIAKIGIDFIKSPVWQIRLMGISLFSAFCAFLVHGLAQPIYYKRFQWLPALLLLTLSAIQKAKNN